MNATRIQNKPRLEATMAGSADRADPTKLGPIVIDEDLATQAMSGHSYLDEDNGKIVREIYSEIKRKTDTIADIHSLLQAARVKIEAFKYLSNALIAAWIVKILQLRVTGVVEEKSKALDPSASVIDTVATQMVIKVLHVSSAPVNHITGDNGFKVRSTTKATPLAGSEIHIPELSEKIIGSLFQEGSAAHGKSVEVKKIAKILLNHLFQVRYSQSALSQCYDTKSVIEKLSSRNVDIQAIKEEFFKDSPLLIFSFLLESSLQAYLLRQNTSENRSPPEVDLFWTNLFNLAKSIKGDLNVALKECRAIPQNGKIHVLTFPEAVENQYRIAGVKTPLRSEQIKRYILNTLFPVSQISKCLNQGTNVKFNSQALVNDLCSGNCDIKSLIERYPALKRKSIKTIDLLLETALAKAASDPSFKDFVGIFWKNLKNLVDKVKEKHVPYKGFSQNLFEKVAQEDLFKIALEQFESDINKPTKKFQDLTRLIMCKIFRSAADKLHYRTLSTRLNLDSLKYLLKQISAGNMNLVTLKKTCSGVNLVALFKDLTYCALYVAVSGEDDFAKSLREPVFWTNLLRLISEADID